jgi:AcrR family transcriptional regulator
MARSGTASKLRDSSHPGGGDTRRALVDAAIETLKIEGFAGASARTIANRAGCNQGLVFYHFGSVVNLLLAALDRVSADRLDHYGALASSVGSLDELVDVAAAIFAEDLDAGHVAVLVQMIAGASSTPGLGPEVAARIAPWTAFAGAAIEQSIGATPFRSLLPSKDVAFAVVALYLGLEMLSHLDDDRTPALALFDRARTLTTLLGAMGSPMDGPGPPAGNADGMPAGPTSPNRSADPEPSGSMPSPTEEGP